MTEPTYPTDRILLVRRAHRGEPWSVIQNPSPGAAERGMSLVLLNECNSYAQYENLGNEYRMIRRHQLAEYGLPSDSPGIGRHELHG